MGLSFTGEAAQNRDGGDVHHTRAGRAAGFPRTPNITPSSVTKPSGPKAIRRLAIFPYCTIWID